MSVSLYLGDCAQVLRGWPEHSVDALVTDPPAGISFMGNGWDGDKGGREEWVAWLRDVMREALRVLKPGAHGLVWALPRTSHWTAWALELAGFEVRDRVSHFQGQGFPKSLNLGDGVGTALKPACEDWWLVRKPVEGTLAQNRARWGTGGLNIGACRINGGRWPAHVTFDEAAAAELDAQTAHLRPGGTLKGGEGRQRSIVSPLDLGPRSPWEPYGDRGGASRFFFVAKAGRKEKDYGCEGLPLKSSGEATGRKEGSAGLNSPRAGAGRTSSVRNHHPTTKSVALMRYLCRLITPPSGLVLDPFMGSGTTGVAALREGLRFAGVEQEFQYLVIANARVCAQQGAAHEEGEDVSAGAVAHGPEQRP